MVRVSLRQTIRQGSTAMTPTQLRLPIVRRQERPRLPDEAQRRTVKTVAQLLLRLISVSEESKEVPSESR